MGERKVLNRYFPPDFDPSLVPKRRFDPYKQVEVRMMLPFSMQCVKCGEYMYRGKKFNSRKEDVIGDDYLGVRKFRFYIKCSLCNNEIAFKTDPQNNDYVCESGATRNFESWRQQTDRETAFENERKEETENNAMKALESRTLDSKIEMDILDALDEIKAVNQRHSRLPALERPKEKVTVDDSAEIEAFRRSRRQNLAAASSSDDDDDSLRPAARADSKDEVSKEELSLPIIKRRKKASPAESNEDALFPGMRKKSLVEENKVVGGLVAYDDSSSSD